MAVPLAVRYVPDGLVVSAINVCNVADIPLPVFDFAVVVALRRRRKRGGKEAPPLKGSVAKMCNSKRGKRRRGTVQLEEGKMGQGKKK